MGGVEEKTTARLCAELADSAENLAKRALAKRALAKRALAKRALAKRALAKRAAAHSPFRGVALAESCTGGLAAAAITDLPGASAWFAGGIVSYSDAAKIALLDVPPQILQDYGAVSEEVARAMCQGAKARLDAEAAAAITGIAGPAGGSAAKPVGTVCFAWGGADGGVVTATARFGGDRKAVRLAAAAFALSRLAAVL